MRDFLRLTNTFSRVSDLFDWHATDDEPPPEIIQLNINADPRALVEQERLEQWRRWVEQSGGGGRPDASAGR